MRITTLTLDLPLHPGDLPGFRACIAELAGREQELFHQHDNAPGATDPYHRDYPLVQYAVRRGRATVIGLGPGADAVRAQVLCRLPPELTIAGRRHVVSGFRMREEEVCLDWCETPRPFGLVGWLALNTANYAEWKTEGDPGRRQVLLSRALTGHLRAMAETLQVMDHKAIHAAVTQVDNQKRIRWHGVQLVRFDVRAEANITVPAGIGIGRAAAFGFGEALAPAQYQRYGLARASREVL